MMLRTVTTCASCDAHAARQRTEQRSAVQEENRSDLCYRLEHRLVVVRGVRLRSKGFRRRRVVCPEIERRRLR
eukprot:3699258-Rhodomonas_salina.1